MDIVRYLVNEKDALSCEISNYNQALFNVTCEVSCNLEILEIIWPKVATSIISPDSISFEFLIENRNIAALKFIERKIIADVSQYDLYDLQIKLQNSVNFIAGLEVTDVQEFAAINESLESMRSALKEYRGKLRLENLQTLEGLVGDSAGAGDSEDEFEAAYNEARLGGDGAAAASASSREPSKSNVEVASGEPFGGSKDIGDTRMS